MKIADYKSIKISKISVNEVNSKDVEEVLIEMARHKAKTHSVTRPAKKGDKVVIDFEGRDEKNSAQMFGSMEALFLGSGTVLPEIEKHLIGASKKEVLTFSESIKGKKLNFKVLILDVSELEIPEINEAFAAEILGKDKSMEDLKALMIQDLGYKRKMDAVRKAQDAVLNALIEQSEVAVEPGMLKKEVDFLKESIFSASAKCGVSSIDYAEKIKNAGRDLDEELRPQAEKNLKISIILDEILKAPEFAISDEESLKVLNKELSRYSPDEKERVESEMKSNPGIILQLKKQLQLQKLFDVVLAN